MLSESQERMLLVAAAGREEEAFRICRKWGLDAAVVGRVTDTGRMVIRHKGEIVADLPVAPVSGASPVYDRPVAPLPRPVPLVAEAIRAPSDPPQALLRLLSSPDLSSKRWIFEQYDWLVGCDTVLPPGLGAAVVRVHGTKKALALTTDCTPRYCAADPRVGGMQAVAEAWRNLVAVGARPLAITDCLNFGNPERPPIMAQLVAAIEGMAEACRALDIPITGGNVSLYNETGGRAIYPTPVVGVVGLLEDVRDALGCRFPEAGLDVLLLGEIRGELGGSEYLKRVHGLVRGRPPQVDLRLELALQRLLPEAARAGLLRSAHDVAAGGLAVTLAECTFGERGVGVEVDVPAVAGGLPPVAATLFGEPAGVVVVSADRGARDALLALAGRHGVPAAVVGRTGGGRRSTRTGRRSSASGASPSASASRRGGRGSRRR
jgi:phosphoribosylformylglycinamidine synthase